MQVKWPAQYGDIYSVKLGPVKAVSISSPELIEVILKSSKLLDKGPSYRYFHPWLGNGLLVSTGSVIKLRNRGVYNQSTVGEMQGNIGNQLVKG